MTVQLRQAPRIKASSKISHPKQKPCPLEQASVIPLQPQRFNTRILSRSRHVQQLSSQYEALLALTHHLSDQLLVMIFVQQRPSSLDL